MNPQAHPYLCFINEIGGVQRVHEYSHMQKFVYNILLRDVTYVNIDNCQ